jgi:hypothetical protein
MTADYFKTKFGYEIDNVWFPRVTSITSSFHSAWKGNGMRQAAEWGTSVHETVEAILRGKHIVPEQRMATTINTFLEWRKQFPLRIVSAANDIEKRVHDVDHGYAGTIDMIAEIDGVRGIVDLKTSTTIVREHALQTAAYLQAYNKTKGVAEGKTRWILRLDQYQECMGCLAKMREKYGVARVSGGKEICNHQWSQVRGEVEFKEFPNIEKDFDAFLALKERWEWTNKEILSKISNYEKNIRQFALL